jgi:hypothetical protein
MTYAPCVTQHPSGRWGFVGSVPMDLAFVDPVDGGPPDPAEAAKRASFGGRFGNVKRRSWATREDALAAADALGYDVAT